MVHAPHGDILLFVKSLEYTMPGDIVCCDPDGIILIRPEYAEKVYKGVKAQIEAEENKIREIEAGGNPWKESIDAVLKDIDGEIVDGYADRCRFLGFMLRKIVKGGEEMVA